MFYEDSFILYGIKLECEQKDDGYVVSYKDLFSVPYSSRDAFLDATLEAFKEEKEEKGFGDIFFTAAPVSGGMELGSSLQGVGGEEHRNSLVPILQGIYKRLFGEYEFELGLYAHISVDNNKD